MSDALATGAERLAKAMEQVMAASATSSAAKAHEYRVSVFLHDPGVVALVEAVEDMASYPCSCRYKNGGRCSICIAISALKLWENGEPGRFSKPDAIVDIAPGAMSDHPEHIGPITNPGRPMGEQADRREAGSSEIAAADKQADTSGSASPSAFRRKLAEAIYSAVGFIERRDGPAMMNARRDTKVAKIAATLADQGVVDPAGTKRYRDMWHAAEQQFAARDGRIRAAQAREAELEQQVTALRAERDEKVLEQLVTTQQIAELRAAASNLKDELQAVIQGADEEQRRLAVLRAAVAEADEVLTLVHKQLASMPWPPAAGEITWNMIEYRVAAALRSTGATE